MTDTALAAMLAQPDVRGAFARPDGGSLRVVHDRHEGRGYLRIDRVDHAGKVMSRIGVQRDEIDRFIWLCGEVRRLELGHPSQEKRVDPVLTGPVAKAPPSKRRKGAA